MFERMQLKPMFTLWLLIVTSLSYPLTASGEAMVLLQGYLGDSGYWRATGVTPALEHAGWRHAGHLRLVRGRVQSSHRAPTGARAYYTVAFPTQAPLLGQHRYLEHYMNHIRHRHAGESLILVGHSAGGVLGRLYMVQHPDSGIDALITIASPHLGTESAELGVMAGESPLAWIAPLIGGEEFNQSQGLYRDLVRERPGSLLFWLNRQQHPEARYVSIVRTEDDVLGIGDLIVPAWSQDMNGVYALRGRALRVGVKGGHGLRKQDGELLIRVINRLHTT